MFQCSTAPYLTDIETTLNIRHLTYVEEDIEIPVLTLNSLVLGQQLIILNDNPENIEDKALRKRRDTYPELQGSCLEEIEK